MMRARFFRPRLLCLWRIFLPHRLTHAFLSVSCRDGCCERSIPYAGQPFVNPERACLVRFYICAELLFGFCQRAVGAARRVCHGRLRSGRRSHQCSQQGQVSRSLRQGLHYVLPSTRLCCAPLRRVIDARTRASGCGFSGSASIGFAGMQNIAESFYLARVEGVCSRPVAMRVQSVNDVYSTTGYIVYGLPSFVQGFQREGRSGEGQGLRNRDRPVEAWPIDAALGRGARYLWRALLDCGARRRGRGRFIHRNVVSTRGSIFF